MMAEDGIPEILAEQRLGHQVPGMRGLYAHASQRMRDELTADLQARWEEIPAGARRHRPALHSPAARHPAGAIPYRTSRATRVGIFPADHCR